MSIDLQVHGLPRHFSEGTLLASTHVPRVAQGSTCSAISHILVATQLQAEERDAVILAIRMAAALSARVTVFHVATPYAPSSADLGDAIDNLHRAIMGEARDWVSAMEQCRVDVAAFLEREVPRDVLLSAEVDVECRVGDVAQEIARYADDHSLDLVVLCDRPSRWRLPVFSSLSQRIERLVSKPVVFGGSRTVRQRNGW